MAVALAGSRTRRRWPPACTPRSARCASLRGTGTMRSILPCSSNIDLGLDGLEVDRAAPLARLRAARGTARTGRRRCGSERARRAGSSAPASSSSIARDLGVGEPRVRAHHRRIELVRVDLARAPSISMSHTMHSRSTSGLSEHSPLDSFSGSIGITRRGKYTELPRSRASRVERVAVLHVVAHVGDRDHAAGSPCPAALAVDGVVEVLARSRRRS